MTGTDTRTSPFSRTVVYELTEGIVGSVETITVEISRFAEDIELYAESEHGEPVPAELAEDRQMLVFEDDVPLSLGDQEVIGLSLREETFAAMQADIRLMETSPDDESGTESRVRA